MQKRKKTENCHLWSGVRVSDLKYKSQMFKLLQTTHPTCSHENDKMTDGLREIHEQVYTPFQYIWHVYSPNIKHCFDQQKPTPLFLMYS